MKWQAVFFDFDGVILDSVDVKTRAFSTMFRPYGPEIERAVVDYHLENGGLSRFKKFEYYYETLLKKSIGDDELESLGQEFNKLSMKGVLDSPFIDGALDTLIKLKKLKVPAFVVSGTPHEEIQVIVEKRNLAEYFVEVHGSPMKKEDIVKNIAKRYSFKLENCLFIGDAYTDYNAAMICQTGFLGVVKDGELSPFPKETTISASVKVL